MECDMDKGAWLTFQYPRCNRNSRDFVSRREECKISNTNESRSKEKWMLDLPRRRGQQCRASGAARMILRFLISKWKRDSSI